MDEHQLDALLRDLGDLARARPRDSEHDVATRLLALAQEHVGCDQAGLAASDRRGCMTTVARTAPMVEQLDRLQTSVGQGPSFQSLEEEQDLVITDVTVERRWSRWQASAIRLGVHGLITVRLTAASPSVRLLTLYFTSPRSITRADLEVAQALARHAGTSLTAAREVAQLHQAIETRTLIGQAQGVLMERYDIDGDHAFAVLRRLSQDTNRKVHVIAAEIARTRQLPVSGPRPAVQRAAPGVTSPTVHPTSRAASDAIPGAPAGFMTPR